MSNYVVGDLQGCYKPLKKLLKKVKFSPAKDKLWCVGDLVNRGPDSLDTLRFLQDMDDSTELVLGNHDLHFIAIHEGCAPARSKDTLDALLDAKDCQQISDWLRHQPLTHYESVATKAGDEDFLMLHAGVAPHWNLQKTLDLAAEVQYALQDSDYKSFLRHMYGDTPTRWHDELEDLDRLRVITNYLTRVRFCDAIGTMDLTLKEGLSTAPLGFKPWFEYEQITPETTILFGHWAALEGYTGKKHIHALDTGYVWGRELTLMRLEDQQLYSIPS
ncbi:MAG: bis(5'-nucleosyl)-tetraphosphatase, symmetrical [Pseudohongiella sp.]|nr:MAG: bis(5'-nucleosyl)-tetraphosphatase, symmetrical [Pseudohongiella sp.]